jgi:serine/threonine-protein kinase
MVERDPLVGLEITDETRIKLTGKIASGGMGAVYEGVQYGSDGFEKRVAVKTILERYTADSDFVDLFIGEARLVADLVHQNIVQIYQLGKFQNHYYMAMEHVTGVNLQEFMNRHTEEGIELPVELGVFIVSRICRGLEYAHNKRDRDGHLLGVVHRDVSPKNIMINTEGEVKITDFGIAKARNLMRDQEGDVLMGKAQYMSPEQAQFLTTDRRSDLFSLGVVMFELLTGYRLFENDETTAILQDVVYKEIPKTRTVDPRIPANVEKIITTALHRAPEKRYQNASQMGYDLEYAIYHKGYGPTIITLEKYMRRLYPELYRHTQEEPKREGIPFFSADGTTILSLGDTSETD